MSPRNKLSLKNCSDALHSHCLKNARLEFSSGPYFPVFGMNTEKYRPEKTPYLDISHAVNFSPN